MSRTNPLIALGIKLLAPQLLKGDREANSDSLPEIGTCPPLMSVRKKTGAIIMVLGRRESGKTVATYRMMESLGRPMFAVSVAAKVPSAVGSLKFEDLEFAPPPFSALFLDDLPVLMGSRDYNDPYVQQVEKMIPVVRHERKLTIFFASQLASLSDKYALDADMVVFKPPSLLYADIERPFVKKWFDKIGPMWEGKSEGWIQRHAFVMGHTWQGLVRIEKPKFM